MIQLPALLVEQIRAYLSDVDTHTARLLLKMIETNARPVANGLAEVPNDAD